MAVNVENVRKVIESIKNEENFFSMADFKANGETLRKYYTEEEMIDYYGSVPPKCETAACIGGWTEHIILRETANDIDYLDDAVLGRWLGLREFDEHELFYPAHKLLNEISRKEAIDVLENLIITGVVNWNINKGENE